MVASAHGTLRGLLKDPELKGLLGGVDSVILSKDELRDRKTKTKSRLAGLGDLKGDQTDVVFKVSTNKSVSERRGIATALLP